MSTPSDLATALVVGQLPDAELLGQLRSLVQVQNQLLAEVLPLSGEVEHRRLYLNQACSSMFGYCTRRLGMSEQVAYQHTQAARAARRFPVILELVGKGDLHLAGVCSLAPHLTEENYEELLFASVRKGRKDIEHMLAGRFPREDVPDRIRKVPERQTGVGAAAATGNPGAAVVAGDLGASAAVSLLRAGQVIAGASVRPGESAATSQAGVGGVPDGGGAAAATGSRPAPGVTRVGEQVVEPLAEARFRVQFTASLDLRGKIQRARELLSHAVPDGNLASVFERGLDLLIEQQEKRRLGIGVRSRGQAGASTPAHAEQSSHSRHIPAAVRRQVWQRDGGQCTFVDAEERRCAERSFLEFEHRVPFGKGGTSTPENVRLLCRAHNRGQAERAYGRRHVARSIAQSKQRRPRRSDPGNERPAE
jgi:hypothetical protein